MKHKNNHNNSNNENKKKYEKISNKKKEIYIYIKRMKNLCNWTKIIIILLQMNIYNNSKYKKEEE